MENTFNNFDSTVDSILFEDQQTGFATQDFFPGGDDENGGGDNEDESATSDNDNPPLDEEVVHSPLTGQTGGKPKTTK